MNSIKSLFSVHRAREREFFIDNLLVRIHFIIVMIRWAGLAPWGVEFPFPGSLTSTFLVYTELCFETCSLFSCSIFSDIPKLLTTLGPRFFFDRKLDAGTSTFHAKIWWECAQAAYNTWHKVMSSQAVSLQGYLAHKKQRPPRTLQQDYV